MFVWTHSFTSLPYEYKFKDNFDSNITTGVQNEVLDNSEEMLPTDGSDMSNECNSPKLNINWTHEIVT